MEINHYDVDEEVVMEIGKFAILWNLYESTYYQYNCNKKDMGEMCKHYFDCDKELQLKLRDELIKWADAHNRELINIVTNGLFSEQTVPAKKWEKKYIKKFLTQDETATDSAKLYGCLLTIYRIRNNFMHGLKDIATLKNQLDLFKAVNSILEALKYK